MDVNVFLGLEMSHIFGVQWIVQNEYWSYCSHTGYLEFRSPNFTFYVAFFPPVLMSFITVTMTEIG